jgi:steroid delta-isomerase-like uncharacterized protein
MSTEEANKRQARAGYQAMNEGKVEVMDQALAPNYVLHTAATPEQGTREAVKQGFVAIRSAFPDWRFLVEDQVAEGDKVVTRWTARGTHKGEFNGIPPTGKEMTMAGITFVRMQDGVITDEWVQMDTLGMLQQLGAIPAPSQSG